MGVHYVNGRDDVANNLNRVKRDGNETEEARNDEAFGIQNGAQQRKVSSHFS
jgi:hypothetical protein